MRAAYLANFNKEFMMANDQDEVITLATLIGRGGGIRPRNPFMTKLARKIPTTLREFMDSADDFINAKDTLRALTAPSKLEIKQGEMLKEKTEKGI